MLAIIYFHSTSSLLICLRITGGGINENDIIPENTLFTHAMSPSSRELPPPAASPAP